MVAIAREARYILSSVASAIDIGRKFIRRSYCRIMNDPSPSPALRSRREFTAESLTSLLTFCFLDTVLRREAVADQVKPEVVKWLQDVNQSAADVKGRKLTQQQWQEKIEALFAKVDLPSFLSLIDFEKLAKTAQPPALGAQSLRFDFQEIEGLPTKLVYGRQIFALKKGRSVVPHGHNNMSTAFLILKGKFQGRHYDRVEDLPQHYLIRPTIDKEFSAGGYSSISDFKDNIHWFQSITDEPAFIFNLHVLGVNPNNNEATGRLYLDPKGEAVAGGLIKARKIDHDESNKLYG